LYEVSDYDECLKICDVGCSASASKRSIPYAHLLNTIGAIHYETNNLKASRKAFETVHRIRLELFGSKHLEVATILANIGNVESAEGNYDEAQDLFESAATIREQSDGPLEESEMLGLTFMQLGRVAALRGDHEQAWKMYQKSEAYLLRKSGHNDAFLAHLTYAYGNLEYDQKGYKQALRIYEECLTLCLKLWPLHHLTASTYYKLACVEYALRHPERALMLLDKATNIAEARDPGVFTGGKARILRKKGEILSEDPIKRSEGLALMNKMEEKHSGIAEQLGLRIEPEDVRTEEAFDLLIPGYFR
jgi:tetratricopeptide (TPR) repeat protein